MCTSSRLLCLVGRAEASSWQRCRVTWLPGWHVAAAMPWVDDCRCAATAPSLCCLEASLQPRPHACMRPLPVRRRPSLRVFVAVGTNRAGAARCGKRAVAVAVAVGCIQGDRRSATSLRHHLHPQSNCSVHAAPSCVATRLLLPTVVRPLVRPRCACVVTPPARRLCGVTVCWLATSAPSSAGTCLAGGCTRCRGPTSTAGIAPSMSPREPVHKHNLCTAASRGSWPTPHATAAATSTGARRGLGPPGAVTLPSRVGGAQPDPPRWRQPPEWRAAPRVVSCRRRLDDWGAHAPVLGLVTSHHACGVHEVGHGNAARVLP